MKRVFGVFAFSAALACAYGDAVDLTPPKTVFDGITEQGYFSVTRELGQVDLGDSFSLPLRVIFNSGQASASPYCGKGWCLTLFESTAAPTGTSRVRMRLPCGKPLYAQQDSADPKKFVAGDWTGILDGDTFTIGRKDGWQLTYRQGRLSQFRTDKGRVYAWNYGEDGASIQETATGKTLVKMERNKEDGDRWTLTWGDQRINFHEGKTDAQGKTLVEIAGQGRKGQSFAWGQKDKAQTLAWDDVFGASNHAAWDGETSQVLSVNNWAYTVTPVKNDWDPAQITRKSAAGIEQFYFNDWRRGVITTRNGRDGQASYFFTSAGPLYGKLRLKEKTIDGATSVVYRAFYDEDGKLLRWMGEDGRLNFVSYDADGRPTRETQGKDGPENWERQYDGQGQVVAEKTRNGDYIATTHQDDGTVKTETWNAGGGDIVKVMKDGKILSAESPGLAKEVFDADGRIVSRTDPGGVFRYSYDDQGRLKEITNNSTPVVRQYYNAQSAPVLKVNFNSSGAIRSGIDYRTGKVLSASEASQAAATFQ